MLAEPVAPDYSQAPAHDNGRATSGSTLSAIIKNPAASAVKRQTEEDWGR
jgi:hypothetical protein